jgi:hypothetical protein
LLWSAKLCFEIGDPAVLEAQAGASGLEPLVEGQVDSGHLADTLREDSVLSGEPLDGLLGPLGLHVPDPAQKFAGSGCAGRGSRRGWPGILNVQRS